MCRYQPMFNDGRVGGASGTGLPYFEGKIRASPVGSPPGLTLLCLRGAPELGCLTRQSVSNGRGDAGAREAARPLTTLLSSIITTSASHSADFPLFFITPAAWRSLDIEGRRQSCPRMDHQGSGSSGRTADTKWMTPVDGPCLQVRTAFKVFLLCLLMLCDFIFFCFFAIKASYSGCAPGNCLWHKRKPPDPVVSGFRRRSLQHKMRHLKYF